MIFVIRNIISLYNKEKADNAQCSRKWTRWKLQEVKVKKIIKYFKGKQDPRLPKLKENMLQYFSEENEYPNKMFSIYIEIMLSRVPLLVGKNMQSRKLSGRKVFD